MKCFWNQTFEPYKKLFKSLEYRKSAHQKGKKNTIIIIIIIGINKLQETFNPLTTTLLAFFKGIMFWEASFWTMPDIFELSKIHG
jgi:hypothetical protein